MIPYELAQRILLDDSKVLYGIFGIIKSSGFFPPQSFLNEFFMVGYDPCDQDLRMETWKPFALSPDDYNAIKAWWISNHPETIEDALGAESWNDWVQEILERL